MQLAASSGRPRGRGFTLVELLISMIVCSLVAAGVATMMVTVSYGTSTSRDLRGLVVKSQVVDARLAAAIRGSRSVLAVGADYLILWSSDTDEDAMTDNAEVRLIERDPATEVLTSYFDATATGDYVDADTLRTAAKASYASQKWGSGVTTMKLSTDQVPPATQLISYRLTVETNDMSDELVGAAAVRN